MIAQQKSTLDNFAFGYYYSYYISKFRDSSFEPHWSRPKPNLDDIVISMINHTKTFKKMFDEMSIFNSDMAMSHCSFSFVLNSFEFDNLTTPEIVKYFKENIKQTINPLEYNLSDTDIQNIINWTKNCKIDIKLRSGTVVKSKTIGDPVRIRLIHFLNQEDFVAAKLKFL